MSYCKYCGQSVEWYFEYYQHADSEEMFCANGEDCAEPALPKRFTEAELSAEYWRKNGDFTMACEGYRSGSDGYVYADEESERRRLEALERFASTPHTKLEPA